MTSFSSWILGIIGIVIIGVLIDLILPDGSISKYVKGVFAFIVILVIVMPLTKINSINVSLENIFSNSSIQVDEDYILSINQKMLKQINTNIVRDANNAGIHNIELNFVSEIIDYQLKINEVNIFLNNVVIDENMQHINKYQMLIDIVKSYVKIDKENINFYE